MGPQPEVLCGGAEVPLNVQSVYVGKGCPVRRKGWKMPIKKCVHVLQNLMLNMPTASALNMVVLPLPPAAVPSHSSVVRKSTSELHVWTGLG